MSIDYDLVAVEWEFEDELPKGMEDLNYDLIYQKSEIIDGVRMFPFVKLYDSHGDYVRYYLSV